MAGRSSIDRDPKAKKAADRAIMAGGTVDDVAEAVAPFGKSRSAAGRYVKRYRALVEDVIAIKAEMQLAREHLPEGDGSLVDLALHKAAVQTLRTLSAIEDEDDPASPKVVGEINRAVRTLGAGLKQKAEHENMVRGLARQRAADAAAEVLGTTGASEATIETVLKRILGAK